MISNLVVRMCDTAADYWQMCTVALVCSGPLSLKPKEKKKDPVLAVVGLRWTAIELGDRHGTDRTHQTLP